MALYTLKVIKDDGISPLMIKLCDNSLKKKFYLTKHYSVMNYRFFDAWFKRFTRVLTTYANTFSRTLTHSWPYLLGFVEGLVLS